MKTNDVKELSPLEKATLPTAAMPGRMGSLGRSMRRPPRRIVGQFGGENAGGQAYHVMSRTTGGEMLFGEVEKEAFRRLMWRMANFSGVEILTYALMDNHFHILVKVPERAKFLKRFEGGRGEAKLLEHLSLLYSKAYIAGVKAELARVRETGRGEEAQAILDTFRKRFCDLSCFVKELKERFSRWFNKHHSRRGTLWMPLQERAGGGRRGAADDGALHRPEPGAGGSGGGSEGLPVDGLWRSVWREQAGPAGAVPGDGCADGFVGGEAGWGDAGGGLPVLVVWGRVGGWVGGWRLERRSCQDPQRLQEASGPRWKLRAD